MRIQIGILHGIAVISFFLSLSCKDSKTLTPVSYEQFDAFVQATNYVTDAERYGWSIVQRDVFNFDVVAHATWKTPDGKQPPRQKKLPVTQVSFNDAMAYCQWAGVRLPTYEEYWELVENDTRPVVTNNQLPISPIDSVNVVGNVWDITATERLNEIRLAGGSLFCSPSTCHGTQKERVLYVDKETGNLHSVFSVINTQ